MSSTPDKVILVHLGGGLITNAYDVLVKRHIKGYSAKKLGLYQIDCKHAKEWMKKHKGYRYVGSEDLYHIPQLTERTRNIISDLERDNFQIVFI